MVFSVNDIIIFAFLLFLSNSVFVYRCCTDRYLQDVFLRCIDRHRGEKTDPGVLKNWLGKEKNFKKNMERLPASGSSW